MISPNPVIGVDFDNTIVSYDRSLSLLAYEKGYMSDFEIKPKIWIRDFVRTLPDGETKWQTMQAEIYGNRMYAAELIDGIKAFFQTCRMHKINLYIVSHKTRFSNLGFSNVDLRRAARKWMIEQEFFSSTGLGLANDDVYFESTRQKKLARIAKLKCTHFIDDLQETYADNLFPSGVTKLLYSPQGGCLTSNGILALSSWQAINVYFFGTNG